MLTYIGLNSLVVPFERYFAEFIEPLKHWLLHQDAHISSQGEARQKAVALVRLTKGASTSLKDLTDNARDFQTAFNSRRLREPAESLEKLLEELNRVAS